MMNPRPLWVALLAAAALTSLLARQQPKPLLQAGLFLGRIEEGARIFTPTRLLPFTHPESEGHQFPNSLQLFGTEFQDFLWLGRQAGYQLWATLERYPAEPSPKWPYPEFSQLPDSSALRNMPCVRRPKTDAPLPGLRAVVFAGGEPACFIVDTRNLTLAERGMARATAMGLDITRADFLAALGKALRFLDGAASGTVIFEP